MISMAELDIIYEILAAQAIGMLSITGIYYALRLRLERKRSLSSQDYYAKRLMMEGEKLAVECKKVEVEKEKLAVEREKVGVEQEKLKAEQDEVAIEREKLQKGTQYNNHEKP